ncbi:hypothetical protein LP419_11040 [Massilia sp. H-1]|nr:hypothetical protein LP419_11040 [Massilia sp. H-1]
MKRSLLILSSLIASRSAAAQASRSRRIFSKRQSRPCLAPPADKAQIVFLEPINAIQGMFPVGLFDMNGDARTHLATTGSHTKVALHFTPGHHVLMAAQPGIKAHFLDVNVESLSKRYFVLLRFVYGNGFQLRPLRRDASSDYSMVSKDFPSWMSETRFVEKTAESDAYFVKFKDLLDKTQADGWATWQKRMPLSARN